MWGTQNSLGIPGGKYFTTLKQKERERRGGEGELTNSIKGNNIEEYEQQITILISSQTFMLPIDWKWTAEYFILAFPHHVLKDNNFIVTLLNIFT